MTDTLVIGYGNPLRGDDAVGPAIAETIQSWQLQGVQARIVQQLVPELCDDIKKAQRVLFVDAATGLEDAVSWRYVKPESRPPALGHQQTPGNLLALFQKLEGDAPDSWLVSIAGKSFEHGDRMTPTAMARMHAALAQIRDWLKA